MRRLSKTLHPSLCCCSSSLCLMLQATVAPAVKEPELVLLLHCLLPTASACSHGAASWFCFSSSAQSCRGRCDEPFQRGRVCECDPQCASYNTCCQDYQLQCCKGPNTHTHTHNDNQAQLLSLCELSWVWDPFSPVMLTFITRKLLSALHLLFIESTTYFSPQMLECQRLTLRVFALWGLELAVSTACLLMLIINQLVINPLLQHYYWIKFQNLNLMDGFIISN